VCTNNEEKGAIVNQTIRMRLEMMENSLNFNYLEQEVIKKELCTRCGSCVAVCHNDCLKMDDNLYPFLDDHDDCDNCGLCFKVCPGREVHFQKLNLELFGRKTDPDEFLGIYNALAIGYANDPAIRKRGASGGVVTAILLYAMENNIADGALIVHQDSKKPWLSKVAIARTKDELINAAQSKYTFVPVNSILNKLKENEQYILVGLPCQVHGFRKMERCDKSLTKKIKAVVGLYCGNNLEKTALYSLLRKLSIRDTKSIQSLEYRAGEWPGGFQVNLESGKTYFVDKFVFNYLTPLYTPLRCFMCIDLTNELSDISVGDAWLPRLTRSKDGWSLIVSRTENGKALIKDAASKGYIRYKTINYTDAILSHSHGFDFKKVGAHLRIKYLGKNASPKYFVNFVHPWTIRRTIIELGFIIFLKMLNVKILRNFVENIPFYILGFILNSVRYTWRKRSKKSF
jgi:coenzyme F420 hydrogenase subunit beta